jgi:hypothetical protein
MGADGHLAQEQAVYIGHTDELVVEKDFDIGLAANFDVAETILSLGHCRREYYADCKNQNPECGPMSFDGYHLLPAQVWWA